MRNCDLFGYCNNQRFKEEGTEFPLPFVMKKMPRLALSCRHPIDGGLILVYAAGLFSE